MNIHLYREREQVSEIFALEKGIQKIECELREITKMWMQINNNNNNNNLTMQIQDQKQIN